LKIAGFLPPVRLIVAHILFRATGVKDLPILEVFKTKLSKEMKAFEHIYSSYKVRLK
jgi:hypothetical protein